MSNQFSKEPFHMMPLITTFMIMDNVAWQDNLGIAKIITKLIYPNVDDDHTAIAVACLACS